MRVERLALLLSAMLLCGTARGDDAGAAAGGPVDAAAPLPSGHPHVEGEASHEHGAGSEEMFKVPEDGATEDPKLASGTVIFQILDADGKAVPNTEVTLGVIYNSVAKGENRKRLLGKTGPTGEVSFEGLDVGSGIAYRVMVLDRGATFSAPPFQLPAKAGMRGQLHVFPVENDVEKTLIVSQSMIYTEVKDDRVQVQQAFKIYNFGRNAWIPQDVVIALPPEYTAFAAQQGMTDVGVEAIPKKGLKLRGTFTPGEHVVEFRWQLPYSGEPEVSFDAGAPPHLAAARVIAPAGRSMELAVDGFPAAHATKDGMGQRALMTEKQLRREETPLKSIRVQIRGLPTEGSARIVATLLAAVGVGVGIALGTRKSSPRDTSGERSKLLADLEALEQARASGDVGPKTYERARRDLVDDIARTLATEKRRQRTARASKGA